MIKFMVGFILFAGLAAPTHISNASKNFTKLDRLAYYVQTHSNNNELVSYHIASALLHAAGDVKTLTAIAEVESNFDTHAVGDSGASIGMFQIQPHHHGVVPVNIYLQAKKASSILSEVKMISKYNGSGKAARLYEAKVKAKRKRIFV
jgi:hypothetical protein